MSEEDEPTKLDQLLAVPLSPLERQGIRTRPLRLTLSSSLSKRLPNT